MTPARDYSRALLIATVVAATTTFGAGCGDDEQVESTTSLITIVTAADSATTTEDTEVTIDVLANDSLPTGGQDFVVISEEPASGTATVRGGQIVYVPRQDFFGTDSLTYVW